MAFRKKADFILTYKPDILIVPECEHPDNLKFKKNTMAPTDILWYGANKNKGLAVFSYNNYKLKLLDCHNAAIKLIFPIAVTGGKLDFTLFAIWAYNQEDKNYNYIGQVWKAIHHYENVLKTKNIILAGDFNSNVIWDKLHRKSNHSMVVEKLESLNIFSSYHAYLNKTQGAEDHPTFFMYRHQDKPYHIDYCFASAGLIKKMDNLEIGIYEQWTQHSDHTPLIVSFKV
jgi:exodeoxyribonuclease III